MKFWIFPAAIVFVLVAFAAGAWLAVNVPKIYAKLFTRRRFGLGEPPAKDSAPDATRPDPDVWEYDNSGDRDSIVSIIRLLQDTRARLPQGSDDKAETIDQVILACQITIQLTDRVAGKLAASEETVTDLIAKLQQIESGRQALREFAKKGFSDPFPARKAPLPAIDGDAASSAPPYKFEP